MAKRPRKTHVVDSGFLDGADLDRITDAYEADDPEAAARIGAEAGGDGEAAESNQVEPPAEARDLDQRARDLLAQAGTAALPRRREARVPEASAAPVQLPEPLAVPQERGRAEAVPADLDASPDEVQQARERAEDFGRRALKLAAAGALDPDSEDGAEIISHFGDLAAARFKVTRPKARAKA